MGDPFVSDFLISRSGIHTYLWCDAMCRYTYKKPSTWYRPQIEGKGYDPHRSGEASWREVGRHERPTVDEQEQRWVNR